MERKCFERVVSKIFKKSNFAFVFEPSLFMEIITKNKRDLDLVTCSFSGCRNVQKFSFFRNPSLGHLRCFNSRSLWVIPKTSIGNQWNKFMTKSLYLQLPLNFTTLFSISQKPKEHLRWNKKQFSWYFKYFLPTRHMASVS